MVPQSDTYKVAVDNMASHHAQGKAFTGLRILHAYPTILTLCGELKPKTMLDYGCGKGQQYAIKDKDLFGIHIPSLSIGLGVDITPFDPGVPLYATRPEGQFDAVVCVDVLEYVPDVDVVSVLEDIFNYSKSMVFIQTTCQQPDKTNIMNELWRRDTDFWLTHISRAASSVSRDIDWTLRLGGVPEVPSGDSGSHGRPIYRGVRDRFALVAHNQLGWARLPGKFIQLHPDLLPRQDVLAGAE